MEEKNYLLNIKSNWKHCNYEALIKQLDSALDLSRAAVFEREVKAAVDVDNWSEIAESLSSIKKDPNVAVTTGFQAKYTQDTYDKLEQIKSDILKQLKGKLHVLQSQYMVQLLQANYLKKLQEEQMAVKVENMIGADDIDLPEMAKLFMQMAIADKDSDELKQIKTILVRWKNK